MSDWLKIGDTCTLKQISIKENSYDTRVFKDKFICKAIYYT